MEKIINRAMKRLESLYSDIKADLRDEVLTDFDHDEYIEEFVRLDKQIRLVKNTKRIIDDWNKRYENDILKDAVF